MNAHKKGKDYQKRIDKILSKKFGVKVYPTLRSGAMDIKGDSIAFSGILSEFTFEYKNQEKLNILDAMRQCINQRRRGTIPALVFTKDDRSDFVGIELFDLIGILLELEELRDYKEDSIN